LHGGGPAGLPQVRRAQPGYRSARSQGRWRLGSRGTQPRVVWQRCRTCTQPPDRFRTRFPVRKPVPPTNCRRFWHRRNVAVQTPPELTLRRVSHELPETQERNSASDRRNSLIEVDRLSERMVGNTDISNPRRFPRSSANYVELLHLHMRYKLFA